jgi:hypothetical protein
MKYALEIDSGSMIYIPGFLKVGSGVQTLLGEIHIQTYRHTHTQAAR